ncbi:hypothetical protein GOP47_0013255 [Adiantum capillus-veneris]|uniref:Cytochrome P450 n=1 Tax=Adiantum capillus-veneris TaxID=13818 RepID=A0A9D4ZD92_ADICA|nr:hypothetical protein GOP47_0013255 [Adiantum capillus-veneris]
MVALLIARQSNAKHSKSNKRLPPRPPGLPLIGHLHLLGKNPHQSFYELSKKYGPLMALRLGSVPILVASSPAMAKQILQTHDSTFANRVRSIASECSVYGGASGITFSDAGHYWRSLRQLCAMQFFNAKRIESFQHVRTTEVQRLVRSVMVEAKVGKSSEIRQKLQTTTNNIVSIMFLGRPLNEISAHGESKHGSMVHLVIEALHLLGKFNVSDLMPWLACMDLQGVASHAKQTGLRMRVAFQTVIDHRRELRNGMYEPPQDFLDILLADPKISDDDIQAMFLDMFGGGSDTSSSLTEWALAELLANPEAMRRVEEEVTTVVGEERPVEEADLPSLPFLQAVAKETMRLHPVLPFLVPHRASHACNVAGYEVAAGTHVFVNTWAISRDPKAWPGHPHPTLQFCPDRFLDDHTSPDIGLQFHFLPFGSGRRTCPGSSLGLLHFHLLLASLLHAFHWTCSSSSSPPDLSERFGIVMTKATPLVALATPKPPAKFYYG